MQIIVNDKTHQCPEGTTVAELLDSLKMDRHRCAVERNRQIVPRATHDQTTLAEGDRLEIVTLVGGG